MIEGCVGICVLMKMLQCTTQSARPGIVVTVYVSIEKDLDGPPRNRVL